MYNTMGLWKKFKEKLKSALGRKAKEKVVEEIVIPERPKPVVKFPKRLDQQIQVQRDKIKALDDQIRAEYQIRKEYKVQNDFKKVVLEDGKISRFMTKIELMKKNLKELRGEPE